MIAGGILHMARQDGYVPMLHAAAHAALQNQKGKNQQHLLRSIKEQFPGRHGITHSSKFHGQSQPISALSPGRLEKRLERLSSSGASEVGFFLWSLGSIDSWPPLAMLLRHTS